MNPASGNAMFLCQWQYRASAERRMMEPSSTVLPNADFCHNLLDIGGSILHPSEHFTNASLRLLSESF
jgi:hypothetical protein